MKSRIGQILQEIQLKREELREEYEKMMKKYDFSLEKGKIHFTQKAKEYQKRFRVPLHLYVIPKKYKHLLSGPFIYGMVFPALFLDLCLFIYQQTAMRLYGIPLVKRGEYIIYDRKHLSYLNGIQKINCLYCSYVNGLFSYAVEVAWRTEKYWCPIKAARSKKWGHDWEEFFADYGDPEEFEKVFNSNKEFFEKRKNRA